MVNEDMCALIKVFELMHEGFNPLPGIPWKLGIPFDPWQTMAKSVVIETVFEAEIRDDITKSRVEVFEVFQHMRAYV